MSAGGEHPITITDAEYTALVGAAALIRFYQEQGTSLEGDEVVYSSLKTLGLKAIKAGANVLETFYEEQS